MCCSRCRQNLFVAFEKKFFFFGSASNISKYIFFNTFWTSSCAWVVAGDGGRERDGDKSHPIEDIKKIWQTIVILTDPAICVSSWQGIFSSTRFLIARKPTIMISTVKLSYARRSGRGAADIARLKSRLDCNYARRGVENCHLISCFCCRWNFHCALNEVVVGVKSTAEP